MKRISLAAGALFTVVLLAGAGCSPTQTPTDTSTTTPPTTDTSTVQQPPSNEGVTGTLSLTADAIGNGMVKLNWRTDSAEVTDEGFMIVRSPSENPIHNGKNFWWRQNVRSREGTWIEVPTGTMHFRICTLKNAECAEYSNDVEVTVR